MKWIKQALSPVIGNEAEALAKRFLISQGLTFVTQNYRCKSGEIDLIMRDKEEWVFVEVKYRSNASHGASIEYFHPAKRRKFTTAVMYFLQENHLNPSIIPHRIDVVGIDKLASEDQIQWLKSV